MRYATHYSTLKILVQCGTPCSSSKMRQQCQSMSETSFQQARSRAIAQGYLTRVRNRTSRRSFRYKLTPKGLEYVQSRLLELRDLVAACEDALPKPLSTKGAS